MSLCNPAMTWQPVQVVPHLLRWAPAPCHSEQGQERKQKEDI